MYQCRQCRRFETPLHAICRSGNAEKFQYLKDIFLCNACLRDSFDGDTFRIITATDALLVIRDKKNKHRYDIIKNVIGWEDRFITEPDNTL